MMMGWDYGVLVSCWCRYSVHVLLVLAWQWGGCKGQGRHQEVVLQIIVPYHASAANTFQSTHVMAKNVIKHGHEVDYKNVRRRFAINSWLNFTDTQSPDEILSIFCKEIFTKHVNTIVSLNYGVGTTASNRYILQLAQQLGYPVISWDPHYAGALQNVEDSRVLQIAPTIYHQCQGMYKILDRYNWTEFAIVTTKISSHVDFISCMHDIVKATSITQGYITKPRYKLLSSVVLDIEDNYDDFESRDRGIQEGLQRLLRTVARVIILHASSDQALDITDAAASYGLIDAKYMWLLTSSSIGRMSGKCTKLPIGALGLVYNNTQETIMTAMETSVKIWARGLEQLAKDSVALSQMKIYPRHTCNNTHKLRFWRDGEKLYRAMKAVRMEEPPLSFSSNGVIENVHLKIYNVRPPGDTCSTGRRSSNQWREVGRIVPSKKIKKGVKTETTIEMDEVVWPGGAVTPPKGKPEKRFFRLVTLKEPPYISYVPPDQETGKCSTYSVPCKLNQVPEEPDLYGNATIDKNGMVEYCCTGLCVDLLKILSEKLMFDYEMYEVHDRSWGIEDKNGEWTGLIKDMLLKRADMVITSIKINHQRAAAMDFSTPFLETGITIMVALRKGAISATAFLEPFDRSTWLLVMLFSIPIVSAFMFISEWFSPCGLNQETRYGVGEPYDYPSWCLILVFSVHATGASIFIFEWLSPSGLDKGRQSLREHKFSLFRSFWLIWAMLFGASVSTDNPRGMSSRFLANVWALFALVFLASYTANLAAFMITIDEYYDLSGIQDWRLMKPRSVTPHFRFATIPGGSTEDNILKNYPRMHSYMQKFNKSKVEEGIFALKKGEIHAFIYDATVLEYNAGRDDDCDLITVGKWYAMTGYGVGFPKGSPYIDEVNTVLLELQQNGELDRLQKFWLAGACNALKDKKDKTSHKIGIPNFTSAFILLAAGVTLATILLLLEHFYFKFGRRCLKKYDKTGCCALVSLSMGKSLTFEHTVLDAIDYQKKHRCKDPLCETQLWKAKHELDLALVKLQRLKDEMGHPDRCIQTVDVTAERVLHQQQEPNGRSITQNTHYETPDNFRQHTDNHVKRLVFDTTCNDNGGMSNPSTPAAFQHPTDTNRALTAAQLSELDQKRLHFRRSPSYTNAISIDSDSPVDAAGTSLVASSPPSAIPAPQPNCTREVSPRRCPSYSDAVGFSPVIDNVPASDTPPHSNRTKCFDGKYYVGVPSENVDCSQ